MSNDFAIMVIKPNKPDARDGLQPRVIRNVLP